MTTPIPLSIPHLAGHEWTYVKECLDTGWVSSVGAFVDRFEAAFSQTIGSPHAIACASGTAALHVGLQIVGVERDDEVIVPSLTFIAPANAVAYLGAHPVFVDAEAEHYQLDVAKVARFLREGCLHQNGHLIDRASGRRVRAILPVHVLGHPVDMDPLLALAREFGLRVVEDATESLGARYRGRPTGTLAEVACFSFNGNKIITTGNGGMIVTPDAALAARAKYLTTQAKDDPIEFVHGAVGYNYRLSNVSAAMGVAQLEQLPACLESKRRTFARYDRAFAGRPGLTPQRLAPWAESNRWLYAVRVEPARFGRTSRELLAALAQERIEARPLWQPLHLSPAYAGARAEPCETAAALARECLCLPSSVGLTEADQARVIDAVLAAATHPAQEA